MHYGKVVEFIFKAVLTSTASSSSFRAIQTSMSFHVYKGVDTSSNRDRTRSMRAVALKYNKGGQSDCKTIPWISPSQHLHAQVVAIATGACATIKEMPLLTPFKCDVSRARAFVGVS